MDYCQPRPFSALTAMPSVDSRSAQFRCSWESLLLLIPLMVPLAAILQRSHNQR
jgi:hypothetical protein